jgi:hypothetical protein
MFGATGTGDKWSGPCDMALRLLSLGKRVRIMDISGEYGKFDRVFFVDELWWCDKRRVIMHCA